MWSRAWINGVIRPRYPVGEQDPQADILDGWASSIYTFPDRLLVTNGIKQVEKILFDGKACRLYPPFSLNEGKSIEGFFHDVGIPIGQSEIDSTVALPGRRLTSVQSNDGLEEGQNEYCHAVRIDFEHGFDTDRLFQSLIDHLATTTWQWWLRSFQSPFRGPRSLWFNVDRNFSPSQGFIVNGSDECASAWGLGFQFQRPIGIERPLSAEVWSECIRRLRSNTNADTGLLLFCDAICRYMSYDDERCILELAICFEVLANKRNQADGGKPNWKIERILERNRLVREEKKKNIVRQLFRDRDHVAHGRAPYIITNGVGDLSIESYLEAMREVVSSYLELMGPGEPDRLASMVIDRK